MVLCITRPHTQDKCGCGKRWATPRPPNVQSALHSIVFQRSRSIESVHFTDLVLVRHSTTISSSIVGYQTDCGHTNRQHFIQVQGSWNSKLFKDISVPYGTFSFIPGGWESVARLKLHRYDPCRRVTAEEGGERVGSEDRLTDMEDHVSPARRARSPIYMQGASASRSS